jgi:ABC-2 type transport system permease protein
MPIAVRLGILTTATVLQIIVPLALVVLLATTLAGEREQGTLRLVCAQGVAPRTLVAGKLLGAAGLLAVVLTPGLAIALVALRAVSPSSDSAAVWWRLAAETAVYGAFLWTFAMLLVLVATVSRTTRQAVLLGTTVWAVVVFIGPRLIADLAAHRYPVPTPAEFASRTTSDRAERPSYVEVRVPDVTRRLMAQYGAARMEDLPIDPTVVALLEEEVWDTARAARRVDWILDVHRARERLSSVLSAAVPALGIQELSRAFAGTDAAHARHFQDYAEGYRQQAVRILTEDVLYRPYVDVLKTGRRNMVGADLWPRIPPFAYQAPRISWVLRGQWLPLTALGLWMVVLTAVAAWCVARIEVD